MDSGESSYRRFLSGDKDGLVELIREYKDGLILYLNTIVGNIDTAEELTEDTFVRLYVKKPKFSGKSSFRTWLYAIAGHIAADHIRKQAKLKEVQLYGAEIVGDTEDVENNYIKDENRIMLYKAMKKLRAEYRQVLSLVYLEDFDITEAAEIMKRTQKQISNLLYRAKNALRSELEKGGYVHEGL